VVSEENGFFGKNPVSADLTAALVAELEQIRRLDAVQATRRAGWGVEGGVGSRVVLAASLGEDGIGGTVPDVARVLCTLSERDFAYRLALSGVLLLPRDAERDAEDSPTSAPDVNARTERSQSAPDVNVRAKRAKPCGLNPSTEGALPSQHGGFAASAQPNGSAPCSDAVRAPKCIPPDDLLLFDEGCYLLDQVNADGLLVATGEEQAELVACWLALRVLTSLQVALEQVPLNGAGASFDTFGLAAWEFPLEPLTAVLARRWQREVLERLLASPASDHGQATARAFLEHCGQARAPWPRKASVRFRVAGDAWAKPALNVVRTLRGEIDEAVEAEQARLKTLIAQGGELFNAVRGETQKALALEVDTLLDDAGLGVTEQFLAALEETTRLRAIRLEQEAERCYARVEELDEPADEAGRVLDELTARFSPCQLGPLLGLVLRPWRLLHLWLLYREIGQRCGVYLAYRQSQWLLQAEAHERQWQAAFYVRMAQAAREEKESVAQLRTRLEQLQAGLAADSALEQTLARRLEAAALPVGLAEHFYRRVTGDGEAAPAGLLAVYGPLSRWARESCEAETVGLVLAEHSREQFAFLAEARLDELLARTYSGAELRRRLAALVDAATPWWACDEPALSAEQRAGLCRLVLVGLPDAGSSLLVDLLPDRPPSGLLSCFSTGDRHQVVVTQVIQGLRPDPLPSFSRRKMICPLDALLCEGNKGFPPCAREGLGEG